MKKGLVRFSCAYAYAYVDPDFHLFARVLVFIIAASAPVSERSVKLRKTKRLTGSTRLGFIVSTFTAIPL